MTDMTPNPRKPEAPIDPMFPDRWSPRSFLTDSIPENELCSLFEAARWAPSCYNEQPWLFIYATSRDDREKFISALVEQNRVWAGSAPVLAFIISRKHFSQSGRLNRHANFDTGAAWLSLALQARKTGLYTHAMAGFNREKAYEILDISEDTYDIIAAVAIGKKGDISALPGHLAEQEWPNTRKPLSKIAFKSKLPKVMQA